MSTSLSIGLLIRAALRETMGDSVTKVYPIVTDAASLPYVTYRRTGTVTTPDKTGRGVDNAIVEVCVYTEDYADGVMLAEKARDALDGKRGSFEGVAAHSIKLTDASEDWEGDAFVQRLVFETRCGQ